MRAFYCVRFSFFSTPSQKIGLGKRLRNDPFCVQWDMKPRLSQSVLLDSMQVIKASTLSACGSGYAAVAADPNTRRNFSVLMHKQYAFCNQI